MILTTTKTTIENSGFSGQATFKMEASRKAFAILSGMYSDIQLAIIREIGSNSMDSHVAAGFPDKPFHIHLPNDLEPWLIIQDFGTGISHSDIYDVYTTYFKSTKTETNEQRGCLGIGGKSFLAYTDTGTVTSITDGVKRIYNVFFNESGMPSIALMSQENTGDSNGLSVQIPVKREDFNKFASATMKAFRFFDVKPTISGGKIVWNNEVPTFEGDGWRSYESFNNHECFGVMGGVSYPIDIYKLDDKLQNFVRHTGLVMFFDMGELDFTPSRESLEYGESTIKAINDKVQFVETNFAEKYNQNIQNKPNILEALKAVYLSERRFSFMSQASKAKAATWNGIDISMPETYCRKLLKETVSVYSYQSYGRSKFRISTQFSLAKDTDWYLDDLARGTEARIKQYIKNNTDKAIMVISANDAKTLIAAGFPDNFIKASTLPKVSYNRGTGTGTAKVGFKIYTCDGYRSWRDLWDSEDYDPNDVPAYFIEKEANGFGISLSSDKVYCASKDNVKTICRYAGIKEGEVVMVGKRGVATLVAAGSKPFKDVVDNLNIVADPVAIATSRNGNNVYNIEEVLKNKDYKALSDTHPFKVYVEQVSTMSKSIEKYGVISGLLKTVTSATTDTVKPLKMETTDPITHILCKEMGSYSWKYADMLKVMLELEKREKELLTLTEKSAIL